MKRPQNLILHYPINVEYEYNKSGNTTQTQVTKSSTVELYIDRTFDARNRLNTIDAAYFDVSSHQIADYDYTGPWRVRKKTLGEAYSGTTPFENGTYLSTAYDGLRRTTGYTWKNSWWGLGDSIGPLQLWSEHGEDAWWLADVGRVMWAGGAGAKRRCRLEARGTKEQAGGQRYQEQDQEQAGSPHHNRAAGSPHHSRSIWRSTLPASGPLAVQSQAGLPVPRMH